MRLARGAPSLLGAAGGALAPAIAAACPYCAARGADHGTLYFIASMILLPYVVGWVVIRAIRKMDSADETEGLNQ